MSFTQPKKHNNWLTGCCKVAMLLHQQASQCIRSGIQRTSVRLWRSSLDLEILWEAVITLCLPRRMKGLTAGLVHHSHDVFCFVRVPFFYNYTSKSSQRESRRHWEMQIDVLFTAAEESSLFRVPNLQIRHDLINSYLSAERCLGLWKWVEMCQRSCCGTDRKSVV